MIPTTSTGRSTLLGRRNPAAKLVVLTFLSLAVLPIFDPVTPALLYGLALVAVACTANLGLRTLLLSHIPFVVFGSSLFLVNAVTRSGDVIAELGPLEMTASGVRVGAALAIRTLLVGVSVVGFTATTDPLQLLTSLRQQLRLLDRVAFSLLAAYRLLDELPPRWESIRRAHAARGDVDRRGRARRGPRTLARAAFVLLVTSIRDAERLAVTLELRGLGAGPRSTWKPTTLDRADAVMVGVVVVVTTAVIGLSAWAGWLRGVSALTG